MGRKVVEVIVDEVDCLTCGKPVMRNSCVRAIVSRGVVSPTGLRFDGKSSETNGLTLKRAVKHHSTRMAGQYGDHRFFGMKRNGVKMLSLSVSSDGGSGVVYVEDGVKPGKRRLLDRIKDKRLL